jgi:ankyrin repeat protein
MLHYAAFRGHTTVLRALIDHGANVNVSVDGITSLDVTVVRGYARANTGIVNALREKGAKGDYFDREKVYHDAQNLPEVKNMDALIGALSAQMEEE